MTRVVCYGWSATAQSDLRNQFAALKQMAAQRGWTVLKCFEETMVQWDQLARQVRPQREAMMTMVQTQQIEVVAVWSLDRLCHSFKDLRGVTNALAAHGCQLFLGASQLNINLAAGTLGAQLIDIAVDFERVTATHRMSAGLQKAAARGIRRGRKSKLTGTLLQEVMGMNKKGQSLRAIVRTLQAKHNVTVTHMTVARVLARASPKHRPY